MAAAPRMKIDPWRLAIGRRLNGPAAEAAARMGAAWMRHRSLTVCRETCDGADCPVPLRVILPKDGRIRALVLDFHGGGWVVGSASLNDRLTAHFAEAGLAVASVDYRLLDDGRGVFMPQAVQDATAALVWAVGEGSARFGGASVFVVGESAGAHLAALALLAMRDRRRPLPVGAIFVQGVFDLSATPSARSADRRTLLFDGPNLARDLSRLVPGADEAALRAPTVSPLYADLTGMPPALFVQGEIDPFRDDSTLMAQAWSEHSEATLLDVPLAPHGFQHFGAPTAKLAQAWMRDWIDRRLASQRLSVDNPDD